MRMRYECPSLRVRFELRPTAVRPMHLAIEWRSHTVAIEGFAPAPPAAAGARRNGNRSVRRTRLVWASGKPGDVYLDLTIIGIPPNLWICGTAFDLSEQEARELAETLGLVGLRIERQQPIKAASTAEAPL